MRIFLVIVGLFFCSVTYSQYPVWWKTIGEVKDLNRDPEFLSRVEKFKTLSKNPESREAFRATKDLFSYVDIWLDIQPDQNEGLLKLNQSMDPLKPLLIELNEKKVGSRDLHMRLLRYLKPDEKIIELSYRFSEDADHRNPMWDSAVNNVFFFKADTPEFRQRLGQRIEEIFKKEDNEIMMLISLAERWKVKETIPALIAILQQGDEALVLQSAQALNRIGIDAKEALPELKIQLEKAKAQGARFQIIEALEFAINSVSGNPPLRSKIAQTNSLNVVITNQPSNTNPLPTNIVTPKTETQQTENSNWLKWVLVGVGLGIVGFLAFHFFRETNSNKNESNK